MTTDYWVDLSAQCTLSTSRNIHRFTPLKPAKSTKSTDSAKPVKTHDIRPGQSIELLKALHILTRDGQLNQDSRRKLKQVYHLVQFIEPLIEEARAQQEGMVSVVDHGAGKSYLGFILYDLCLKKYAPLAQVVGVETRGELVDKSKALAMACGFESGMRFINLPVAQTISHPELPQRIDVVTALHACNTATDDAIDFALAHQSRYLALVPCCQAEVAAELRRTKGLIKHAKPLAELWRHPLHTREFGSQLTNVLRCLRLEAQGYQVTVTELVGWEHSMKNELIIAKKTQRSNSKAQHRLEELLKETGLIEIGHRFGVPQSGE